jgi:cytoskeletal protein CcmA (bactofilin family)
MNMTKGFGDSKLAPPTSAAPAPAQGSPCVLGPTLHFKGELYGEEDLEFQGQLEGTIEHTRSLSIGKEGGVKGNIKAKFVIVEGRVDGDIYATESVQIRQTAKVVGNIFAPRVGIADGAHFSGSIDMNHKGAAATQRPATVQVTLSEPAAERLLTKAAG